jgi:hypothetical protein
MERSPRTAVFQESLGVARKLIRPSRTPGVSSTLKHVGLYAGVDDKLTSSTGIDEALTSTLRSQAALGQKHRRLNIEANIWNESAAAGPESRKV